MNEPKTRYVIGMACVKQGANKVSARAHITDEPCSREEAIAEATEDALIDGYMVADLEAKEID